MMITDASLSQRDKDAPAPKPRHYRPLDVQSYSEGFRVIVGWLLVPWLAVVTGLLLWQYEKTYINITDRDVRDMYYDARVTGRANNFYHKNFINAEVCCNPDPVVFQETSDGCFPPVSDLTDDFRTDYQSNSLVCPPTLMLECPDDLRSPACWQARVALFTAAGIDASTGQYSDCARAGRVLVGSRSVGSGRPMQLVASIANQGELPGGATTNVAKLTIPDAYNISQSVVNAFVDSVAAQYSNPSYFSPNIRLSKAFAVDGKPVALQRALQSNGLSPIGFRNGPKAIDPWPTAIFDFPGMSKRCPDANNYEQWWLDGTITLNVPPFRYDDPQPMAMRLTFLNDHLYFSPWRVVPAAAASGDEVCSLSSGNVSVQILNQIKVWVGLASVGGACNAWLLDTSPGHPQFKYTEVYNGTLGDVGSTYFKQSVEVIVYDTAAPERIALPFYYGMWFIVFAFGMAAVWTFSLGLFILTVPWLIWWNVRDNHGLPPFLYRWMRKYRGW